MKKTFHGKTRRIGLSLSLGLLSLTPAFATGGGAWDFEGRTSALTQILLEATQASLTPEGCDSFFLKMVLQGLLEKAPADVSRALKSARDRMTSEEQECLESASRELLEESRNGLR